MFSKAIDDILHKNLQPLPQLLGGASLRHDIDELLAMVFSGMKLAVVDDAQTSAALGDQVFRAVRGKPGSVHITLAGTPSADMETVGEVRRKTASCDALVAVGSGTLGDVCKYASFLDHKPYAVFPTAASMNGYLSANASIEENGYKKTFAAHMPKALFCDFSVIAAAPARLNKSGMGDSLARPTAQADWLLSHLLMGTAYSEVPFDLLKGLEPHLLESARGVAAGDRESIELLMQVLLLSGLGMTIAGGSYPASQGEHMIAHAMHMQQAATLPATFHGEEIGVTALAMAHLQQRLLHKGFDLQSQNFNMESLSALFGQKAAEEAKKSYRLKQETMERMGTIDAPRWESIAHRIEAVMLPAAKIELVLKAMNAPSTPEALRWPLALYNQVSPAARFLRDRFTFLDLQ